MTTDRPVHRPCGIDCWIFDLDNTLYPASCNVFPLIERRMGAFIASHFGLSPEAARQRQKHYFRKYGTTLRGLMVEHAIDPGVFLDYVHAIDLSVIVPDPGLDRALARLPGRKLVYTNASRRHALAVMARLGIASHFEAIHDIADAGFLPKPDPRSYDGLVAQHAIDPARACLIEDMAGNLVPAAALGMATAWVRTDLAWCQPEPGTLGHIHYVIDDLAAWLGRAAGA